MNDNTDSVNSNGKMVERSRYVWNVKATAEGKEPKDGNSNSHSNHTTIDSNQALFRSFLRLTDALSLSNYRFNSVLVVQTFFSTLSQIANWVFLELCFEEYLR